MPQRVTDEELRNFLIKAERLINARPLTKVPIHADAPALTPNHFLFGSSNGADGGENHTEWREATDQTGRPVLNT